MYLLYGLGIIGLYAYFTVYGFLGYILTLGFGDDWV